MGTPGLSVGTRLTGRAPDTQLTTASCLDSNPPGHPFSPRLRGVQDQPRLTAWPRGRGLPREAPSPPGSCALQGEGGLEPAGQLIPAAAAAAVRRGEGGRNNAPTRTAPAPKCPAVTHAGQAPRQTPRNFSGSGGTGRGGGGGGRACVICRRGAGRGAWGRPAGAAPPRGRSAAAQEGGSCSAACHRSESPWRGGRGWKSPLRWGFFLCLVK